MRDGAAAAAPPASLASFDPLKLLLVLLVAHSVRRCIQNIQDPSAATSEPMARLFSPSSRVPVGGCVGSAVAGRWLVGAEETAMQLASTRPGARFGFMFMNRLCQCVLSDSSTSTI
jgi:hypothetical protein